MDTYEEDGHGYLTPEAAAQWRSDRLDRTARILPVASLAVLFLAVVAVYRFVFEWDANPVTGWWWAVWAGIFAIMGWCLVMLTRQWRTPQIRDRVFTRSAWTR